ncbi:T9SS type A sorting domain-containing protein [bacterium]|nr:T9SS type A sorting domain-containing protein [bacterium]
MKFVSLMCTILMIGLTVPDIRSQSLDQFWNHEFAQEGVNGPVHAVLYNPTNKILYVGGEFTTAGGVPAKNLAQWDGWTWSQVGGGVDGTVLSLAKDGVSTTGLYVGGGFHNVGGSPANYLAHWNGSSWSSPGGGCNQAVWSMLFFSGDLYIGGDFTTAGGVSASHIARYSGGNFYAMGSGFNNNVTAIEAVGSTIYAGGTFTQSGDSATANIAQWTGTAWQKVGGGTSGFVFALESDGTNLYAGGTFQFAGGILCNNVAKWNGSSWSAFNNGVNGSVYALLYSYSELYVGGSFNATDHFGNPVQNYIIWSSSEWSAYRGYANNAVRAITLRNDLPVVGGDFTQFGLYTSTGSSPSNHLAIYNSSLYEYTPIGKVLNLYVDALAVTPTALYVSGLFNAIGDSAFRKVAKWNGVTWEPLGSGINSTWGQARTLATHDNDVYVGGYFDQAGGSSAGNIAKWNGSSWNNMAGGVNGGVQSIKYDPAYEYIYAGGYFTSAGGGGGKYIARYNGTNWSVLGSDDLDSAVVALDVDLDNGDVYAGGLFTTGDGKTLNHVAKWNGASWSNLGAGIDGPVYAVKYVRPYLYVGGQFTHAGGVEAKNIARWNGFTWEALGSGIGSDPDDVVRAIEAYSEYIYAGGRFGIAGGIAASGVARWDGHQWSAMGSTSDPYDNQTVVTIAAGNYDIYFGGIQSRMGGQISHRLDVFTNVPPIRYTTASDRTLDEDSGTDTLTAAPAIEDPDPDLLTTSVVSSRPSLATVELHGSRIFITPAHDSSGVLQVYVTATDPAGQSARDTFSVTITPVNDPPILVGYIDNKAYVKNFTKTFVAKLSSMVTDIDNAPASFSYQAVSKQFKVNTTISNDTLYLSGANNQTGLDSVWVQITDGQYSVYDTFTVNISAVNTPPQIVSAIRDTSFFVNTVSPQLIGYLSFIFQDTDGPSPLAYSVFTNGAVGASIAHDSLLVNFGEAGSGQIVVQASDGLNATTDTFTVSIIDNVAPTMFLRALASPVLNRVRFVYGGNEPLSGANVKVNNVTLTTAVNNSLYFSDYDVTSAGNLTVIAVGTDLAGNDGQATRTYQVTHLGKSVVFGSFNIETRGSGYLLLTKTSVEIPEKFRPLSEVVEWTSGNTGEMTVTAVYTSDELDEAKIGIYEFKNGAWNYAGGEGHDGHVTAKVTGQNFAVMYNADHDVMPKDFALEQNFPNPFNPTTTIRYKLATPSHVQIIVYNLLGQQVTKLVDNDLPAGSFQVLWNGKNQFGQSVSSGVYLYRLRAGGRVVQTKKMTMIK